MIQIKIKIILKLKDFFFPWTSWNFFKISLTKHCKFFKKMLHNFSNDLSSVFFHPNIVSNIENLQEGIYKFPIIFLSQIPVIVLIMICVTLIICQNIIIYSRYESSNYSGSVNISEICLSLQFMQNFKQKISVFYSNLTKIISIKKIVKYVNSCKRNTHLKNFDPHIQRFKD